MPTHPFLVALRPVAKALGATIVPTRRMQDSDIPLHWEGALVGGLRMPDLQDALARLIAGVEQQLGGELGVALARTSSARVRMLEERGAFQIRKSIEDTADAMGVAASRSTTTSTRSAIERCRAHRASTVALRNIHVMFRLQNVKPRFDSRETAQFPVDR